MQYFRTSEDLQAYFSAADKHRSFLMITHRELKDYLGMVATILLRYSADSDRYTVEEEYSCWGLDFYGEITEASREFSFTNINEALDFLQQQYCIRVTDIPVSYKLEIHAFPNPEFGEAKKSVYEEYRKKFQEDFKSDKFRLQIPRQ